MTKWKYGSCVRLGLDHIAEGTECQDYALIREGQECIAAALADGVGMLENSALAASVATKQAVEWLLENSGRILAKSDELNVLKSEMLNTIKMTVRNTAKKKELSSSTMDCNLTFACIYKYTGMALIGQLGDCALCAIGADSRVYTASSMHSGGTASVLSAHAVDDIQMKWIDLDEAGIDSIVMTSDGLEKVIYRKGSAYVYKPAEEYVNLAVECDLETINDELNKKIDQLREEKPEEFRDDISIVLLTRAEKSVVLPKDPQWLCTCGHHNSLFNTYCENCQADFFSLYRDVNYAEKGGVEEFFRYYNEHPGLEKQQIPMLEPATEREKPGNGVDAFSDADSWTPGDDDEAVGMNGETNQEEHRVAAAEEKEAQPGTGEDESSDAGSWTPGDDDEAVGMNGETNQEEPRVTAAEEKEGQPGTGEDEPSNEGSREPGDNDEKVGINEKAKQGLILQSEALKSQRDSSQSTANRKTDKFSSGSKGLLYKDPEQYINKAISELTPRDDEIEEEKITAIKNSAGKQGNNAELNKANNQKNGENHREAKIRNSGISDSHDRRNGEKQDANRDDDSNRQKREKQKGDQEKKRSRSGTKSAVVAIAIGIVSLMLVAVVGIGRFWTKLQADDTMAWYLISDDVYYSGEMSGNVPHGSGILQDDAYYWIGSFLYGEKDGIFMRVSRENPSEYILIDFSMEDDTGTEETEIAVLDEPYIVVVSSIRLRESPGYGSKTVSSKIPENEIVYVLDIPTETEGETEWICVQTSDGIIGWCEKSMVEPQKS